MFKTSGRAASIIQILICAMVIATVWMNASERSDALEKRIEALEAEARALEPLSRVMRGYQPGRAIPDAYAASQATGAPNVPEPGDNGLAWCPVAEDAGSEWLELQYGQPVSAKAVLIVSSFNPGVVVRVLGAASDGEFRELWAAVSPAEVRHSIPLSPPAVITRVRLELDTAKVPGWNEIDAVGLVDEAGAEHWATRASSSSVWGK